MRPRLLARVSLILSFLSAPLSAAPYPPDGFPTSWVQPSGAQIELRVFGDEFYARTTKDGFTVIFVPERKAYEFATLSADRRSLVTTGIPADQAPPAQLPRDLAEPKEAADTTREANLPGFPEQRARRWEARVKSVQRQRERAAGVAPRELSPLDAAPELGAPVTGSKQGLMILVQFPDDPETSASDPLPFPATQAKMVEYANATGYTQDGNTGSIRDYFFDQSNGLLIHTQVVTSVVTLPHPRNFYNFDDYPRNASFRNFGLAGRMLVQDAVAALRGIGFDFSNVSADSGGEVYAASLLFAGPTSGVWAKGLWPHAWSIDPIEVGTPGNSKRIVRYQCTNVANSAPVIGTVAHELGHMLLSYPDLYDTDSYDAGSTTQPTGASEGIGMHCLMGSGNHCNGGRTPAPINAYLKDISGWANITDVIQNEVLDTQLPSTGNRAVRLRKPDAASEYFLIENRGTGDRWAAHTPDTGLLIWHVDESVTTANKRQHMTSAQHYQVSLEQADGEFHMERNRNRGDQQDLYDRATRNFAPGTTPNSQWWNGSPSQLTITATGSAGSMMSVRLEWRVPGPTVPRNLRLRD